MLQLQRLKGFGRTLVLMWSTDTQRNILYLYLEVIFAGVLAAAGSFNSAYILRLGGSRELVGLLSSIPSLVAIFLFIPSARILERQKHHGPWIVGGLVLARA
ncbi:MAG: hypothetical protein H5T69_02225, partial [Chloroflexi bacterium]|nr:hypothetical protein [Chloroflexota bacterium]